MSKTKYVIVNKSTGKERAVAAERVLSPMGKESRMDGWQSIVTGIGTAADKRMSNQVNWSQHDMEFYEQLYSGDELAARLVDVVPQDALRKFVEFLGYEKNELQSVHDRCQSLDLRGSCERAWIWARAFGGALQYVVTDTDDPASPLEDGEQVMALRELSRYDLRILTTDIETDFGSENFGRPNIYYLNVQIGTNVKLYPIHWTRCIRYDGKLVPRRTYIRNNYWHDSELQRLFNVIRNYQSSNDSAASILQDFNVGIFKMKDLVHLISAGKEKQVKDRIELINYSKSVINAMILDAESEEYVDVSRNLTGLPEMLKHQANRFVAATDIPHTKLLGESPDGSNATGNSTTQLWYEYIESQQNNYFKPKFDKLIKIIFSNMDKLTYKFKPLAKLSDTEEADLRNKQATTDAIYITNGVVDASEIAQSRFGGDTYSSETKLDLEARAAGTLGFNGGGEDEGEGEEGEGDGDEDQNPDHPPRGGKNGDQASEKGKTDSESDFSPLSSAQSGQRSPGIESHNNPNWKLKNQTLPVKTKKVEPFISQTMSEPFRDPKTDPKTKPPGKPNNPRKIDYTAGDRNAIKLDSDHWEEGKHPRAGDGKFGSGGGGGSGGNGPAPSKPGLGQRVGSLADPERTEGEGSQVNSKDKDEVINKLSSVIKDKDYDKFMDQLDAAFAQAKVGKIDPKAASAIKRSHNMTFESDPENAELHKRNKNARGKDLKDPSIIVEFGGHFYAMDGQHRLNQSIKNQEGANVAVVNVDFMRKMGVTEELFAGKQTFDDLQSKQDAGESMMMPRQLDDKKKGPKR